MYCYYTTRTRTTRSSRPFLSTYRLHCGSILNGSVISTVYNGGMTSDSSVFNAKENLSAVILAGGRGSRMGHSDKGLIMLAGRPLIEHVIERIAVQAG